MLGSTDSLGLAAALFLLLGGCHHIALRGVPFAVRVLVVEVQTPMVEVRLDILGDGLPVIPFDALDQHRLAVLQVCTLFTGQLHVPTRRYPSA